MESKEPDVQKHVVTWLQTLCHLGVIIPLDILFSMFSTAIKQLDPGDIPEEENNKMTLDQEADVVKSVQILTCMLDVLIVQLKIQVVLFYHINSVLYGQIFAPELKSLV